MGDAWRSARGLLLCPKCHVQTSVTAGTVFEGTRKPLKLWFMAVWEIVGRTYGSSALTVQRVLGLKSYKTAWSWLHKLRRAMMRPDGERLNGVVEVGETHVGGQEAGSRSRFTETRTIVAVAVEVKDVGCGRVRLRRVPNLKRASLESFVRDAVEPGATIRTDASMGYARVGRLGFGHEVVNPSESEDPPRVIMPGVHRVASLLKRLTLGTYHGGIGPEHLEYYLDEFTFRFNRRSSRSRGLPFYRLLEAAVQTGQRHCRRVSAAISGIMTRALCRGNTTGTPSFFGSFKPVAWMP